MTTRLGVRSKDELLAFQVELPAFQDELEFGSVGFCGKRKTVVPGENLSEQGREPTTNSTHIRREYGNQPRATMARGDCSHHCAIPAPQRLGNSLTKTLC